jgi:hypothetical protein
MPVEDLFHLLKGNTRLISLVLRTGDDAAWGRKITKTTKGAK